MIQESGLLIQSIDTLFKIMNVLLIIRVILSWIPHDPFNRLISIVNQLTDPILSPIKRLLPPLGGIDFSPILAFFLLEIIKTMLIQLLA